MTLTRPRLLTVLALLVIVLTAVFLARSWHSDPTPAVEQAVKGAIPEPELNSSIPWLATKSTRPDPKAAVVGGPAAGVASDAAAAVAAAADATSADTANP